MTAEAQNQIKTKNYAEAMRYMQNATATLKEAGKYDKFYCDAKYVKTACGIAYNGVLIALDTYLTLKEVPLPKKGSRRDKQFYEMAITKLDKKLLNYYENAYSILHLYGYYDGTTDVAVIQEGFKLAYNIIEKINPATS
jgi:hypothetical protein